ncbi:MAG: NAD(P)/FAD-dependent oxidoreductase [Acetobacteraceae bacterium]
MNDIDVVVIGAGAAGLAAARALRELGRRAAVLEASGRIGGRAWTVRPPELGGVWFDMGAIWLHDAEHNPLTPIARAANETLLNSADLRSERTFVGDRLATEDEIADYDDAPRRFEQAADELLADGGDVALATVARALPGDAWARTVEAWEGPVICAADAEAFSLRDWKRNALSGSNLVPDGGIGAFIARLGDGLDIRLHTEATRVVWAGSGGAVRVTTPNGDVRARACIVTVSTGVLGAGAIGFDPVLPEPTRRALDGLPMGLALKVALRATGADRLDLPMHCALDHRVARSGDPFMIFQCWPYGRDYVQAWIGGSPAWELGRQGDDAACDFALGELRRMFGARADRLFAGGARLVTHWGADPFVRGAYSYARPGEADARAALAEPLADGHLVFAGEACHDGLAGTVGGAWLSGEAAATIVARALA